MTDNTLRVMFDTNAYDAILAAGDLERLREKVAAGELSVVTTHIQEDEIRQIRDPRRQRALLDAFRTLRSKHVPTSIALWGESRWGQSKWAGEIEKDSLSAIQRNKPVAARDEIIGTTAAEHCDVLVTDDRKLAARMNAAGSPCRAMTYDGFTMLIGIEKPSS